MANNKGYKRSWKNYLLDANYQLRFTFTMLAVAAGLMTPLGLWVSDKAERATEVALNQIDGIECKPILSLVAPAKTDEQEGGSDHLLGEDLLDESAELPPESVDVEPVVDPGNPEPAEAGAEMEDTGEDGEEAPRKRRAIVVDIDDSEMPVVTVGQIEDVPPTPEAIAASKVANENCQQEIAKKKASVNGRKSLIRWVMLLSGVFLLFGLGLYGIKTTHRVAGPLFKVGLYLGKLENNRYTTVYSLRKGDQLVDFYEHFKKAHAGAEKMQHEDIERLRDAIALAKDAGLAEKTKGVTTIVKDLERLLEEKEKSLEQA